MPCVALHMPNVMADTLVLLLCSRQVTDSNLGLEVGQHDRNVL
jgi:hypothetical protein